jgi:hypothetical protein
MPLRKKAHQKRKHICLIYIGVHFTTNKTRKTKGEIASSRRRHLVLAAEVNEDQRQQPHIGQRGREGQLLSCRVEVGGGGASAAACCDNWMASSRPIDLARSYASEMRMDRHMASSIGL